MEKITNIETFRQNKIDRKVELILALGEQATTIERQMNTLSLELSELGTSVEEELTKRETQNE